MSGRRRSIRTTIGKPLFASAVICGRKLVPFDAVTVSSTVTKIPGGTVIFLGVTNLIYESICGSRSFEVTEERREFSFRCVFRRNRPRSSAVFGRYGRRFLSGNRYHGDDVILESGRAAAKGRVRVRDFHVFDGGRVHEGLAIGRQAFFESVNL